MSNDQLPREEASEPDSPGSHGVSNIFRWWSRRPKGVENQDVVLCLKQSVGLAYGNDNCETFYEAVNAQPSKTRFWKGSYVEGTAASLGWDLAVHPNLRWLASTVAGLYHFHSKREDFIHATILAFVVQANRKPGALLSERNAKYDPRTINIQRAIKTVINGVWFHVGNTVVAKSQTAKVLPLPTVLDGICECEGGHYLEPFELGSRFAQVRAASQAGGEIVVESMYLIKDMVWWLWYHFPGNLTVVVGGQILTDKPGGHPNESVPRRIEVRIQKSCPLKSSHSYAGHHSNSVENTVKIHTAIAGKVDSFFERIADNTGNALLGDWGPAARIHLYDIPTIHRDGDAMADLQNLQPRVRSTAVIIVSWLLDLPVSGTVEDSPDLAFTVWSNSGPKKSSAQAPRMPRVMDLVTRSPLMLNMGWGYWNGDATAVFKAPSVEKTQASSKEKAVAGDPATTTEFGVVLYHYPILNDLVSTVGPACKCMSCRQENERRRPPGNAIFDKGCLRNKTLMEVLHLIAHAIADCFGCDDASAPSSDSGDLGVLALLAAVARGIVRWND